MALFSDFHMQLWRAERPSPNAILKGLATGWDSGADAHYSCNSLGFDYVAKDDQVAVFSTFKDGSDEIRLSRGDFCSVLEEIKRGELR